MRQTTGLSLFFGLDRDKPKECEMAKYPGCALSLAAHRLILEAPVVSLAVAAIVEEVAESVQERAAGVDQARSHWFHPPAIRLGHGAGNLHHQVASQRVSGAGSYSI